MGEKGDLEWLQEWFLSECNGDWEHSFGIEITTSDNPGWILKIDLDETALANLHIPYRLVETSENDWYGYSVTNAKFDGGGDPMKLSVLIRVFRMIVEDNTTGNRT